MLRAENLVKVYDAAYPDVRALGGVSFSLPARGMVFIVGKSGSGKSTLMNILGGLDAPTEGEVYIDGKPCSALTPEEADAFRGEKIGFVFQDFLLFDKMTAEENVRVSLDLAGESDDGAARAALARVDMERFCARKPKQLSAGQKQRVAIARALVKNPRIVFADEPTGNIDAENTELVLDLLKDISKDALVVVISHSESDAHKYADRIIRLADGKVASDTERDGGYADTLEVENGEARLPARPLTDEELTRLNGAVEMSGGKLRITQKDGGFVPVREQRDDRGAGEWKKSRMKPRAFLRHSLQLMAKGWVGKAVLCLVAGLMLALFAVAQSFAFFDAAELISTYAAGNGDNGIIMRKGYTEGRGSFVRFKDDRYVAIDGNDVSGLAEAYDGKIFGMYSVQMTMKDEVTAHALETWRISSPYSAITYGYATETNGVLVCDFDYLKMLFGDESGNLKLVAGEIPTCGAGVVVTDYVLDAYTYFSGGKAEDLLAVNYADQRISVAGIIDTGYKDEYADLLEAALSGEFPEKADKRLADFIYDVNNYLTLCYSVNADWKADYVAEYAARTGIGFAHFSELTVSGEGGGDYTAEDSFLYYDEGVPIDGAYVNYEVYNKIFGTTYSADNCELADVASENKVVTVALTDRAGNVVEPRVFRVLGLAERGVMKVSKDYLAADKAGAVQVCALYLTDTEKASECLPVAEEMLMYPVGEEISALMEIAAIADMLAELLTYIAFAVAALIVIVLLLNAYITVRGGMYQIGMLRALGSTTARVGGMFLLQIVAMALFVCAVGAAGCALGVHIADGVVADYVAEAYPAAVFGNISIASYDSGIMAADCAVAAAVVAACGSIPVLAVRKINPVSIIRARE